MITWPTASTIEIEVDNELWRNWDETSHPMIRVHRTVPAYIADAAVPALDRTTSDVVAGAERALDEFASTARRRHVGTGHISAVLLRADAVASSQIEAIATTTEQLSVALAGDYEGRHPFDDAALIADHVETAQFLLTDQSPLDEDWFHRSQAALLRHDRDLPGRYRGAWRDCPVWIGSSRENADFEGPDEATIGDLIADLIRFLARRDVRPIVHTAIAHAQFETIHPYADGNGRVGRLLIHRLLDAGGTPVPVSHGLLADTTAYVRGLTAYRAGDLDTWVVTFAGAITAASEVGTVLLRRLDAARRHLHDRVATRGESATRRLLDDLVRQPAVTVSDITHRYDVTESRASQLLNRLGEAGILRRSELATGRERIWVAPVVIAALDSINRQPRRLIGPDI